MRTGDGGRDTLQGACAPPHKGRGRGPQRRRRQTERCEMGGAGTERSVVESPWRVFLPLYGRSRAWTFAQRIQGKSVLKVQSVDLRVISGFRLTPIGVFP